MRHIDDAVAACLSYCCKNRGKASHPWKDSLFSIQVTGSRGSFSLLVSIIHSPGQMPAVTKFLDLRHTTIYEQLNAGDETADVWREECGGFRVFRQGSPSAPSAAQRSRGLSLFASLVPLWTMPLVIGVSIQPGLLALTWNLRFSTTDGLDIGKRR